MKVLRSYSKNLHFSKKNFLLKRNFGGNQHNSSHLKSPTDASKKFEINEIVWPRKVFSGIQPTGAIHIGNYLGAIRKWKELQDQKESATFCIVDLHSITIPIEASALRQNILNLTATMLACDLDPKLSTIYVQSTVKEHAELNWILSCLSTMARLAHLPQYKEKTQKMKEIPLGLFVYPVLQAADIMLFKATHVPVGEDQVQHIQLCQHLAKSFNFKYGTTFPYCHALIDNRQASRILSLRSLDKKMSKSDPDQKGSIYLTDSSDQILRKIKKAVTDFTSEVTFDIENRPGVSNLLTIHSLMTGKSIEDICAEVKFLDTGKYKFQVAEAIIEHLSPIRNKIEYYLKNKEYLICCLEEGREKASTIAEQTMTEVKNKIGLGPSGEYGIPEALMNQL
ncbi:tryptophan--tRNA ligase, mitochondrial [Condylostylus longicornis]|uniref:tryptophan--tRNA ligase, mitochondrial n=1 Tax=Condylostylus longicornis TaxID=2530218 RepID=UPI00244E09E3|nr:tryptophan--tRNA ligase, mitochondrial [Condylostylus longicornis]